MKAMEKIHGHHAKEYEKALKVFPFLSNKGHLLATESLTSLPNRPSRVPLRRATTLTKVWAELPASSRICAPTPNP